MTHRVHGGANPEVVEQQAYWDDRWGKQETPNDFQKRRSQEIIRILKELPLDHPRILDVGCATGWMTKMLSEFGTAEGVDLSETAIEKAKKDFPGIKYTAGDLYEIELTSEPVDLVVCQEVIPHVSDQPLLMRRIAEVIKPGGYLIITAANRFVMERMRDVDGIGVGDEDPEAHIKKWLSMKELKAIIKPYFNVLDSTSVIPMGHRGCLRIINSTKLARVLCWFMTSAQLDKWKELMGFGYSIIVLGQKKP